MFFNDLRCASRNSRRQLVCQRRHETPIDGVGGLLVVNKPTGQWEMPKKKTVRQLFTIGAKATEDDFDRKARYIKYIFWGVSVLLFVGFFVIY